MKETWLLVCKPGIFTHLHHFLVQMIHVAVIKKTTAFSQKPSRFSWYSVLLQTSQLVEEKQSWHQAMKKVSTRNLGLGGIWAGRLCVLPAEHIHSLPKHSKAFPLFQLCSQTLFLQSGFSSLRPCPYLRFSSEVFFGNKLPDCPSLPHRFVPQSSLTAHKPESFRKNKPKDVLQKHT